MSVAWSISALPRIAFPGAVVKPPRKASPIKVISSAMMMEAELFNAEPPSKHSYLEILYSQKTENLPIMYHN